MSKIKYLFISKEYTICSGIDNVENGIEINLKGLFLNLKALEVLSLVSIMCDLSKPDYTFRWYCSYLSQFVMKESEERNNYNLTNPKIQILCSGDLLENLRAAF